MILDLTSIQKPVLKIKLLLNNDEETLLEVLPASKNLIDKMVAMTNSLSGIYEITADILSCNTKNINITVANISQINILDIKQIFKAYQNFIMEISDDPN